MERVIRHKRPHLRPCALVMTRRAALRMCRHVSARDPSSPAVAFVLVAGHRQGALCTMKPADRQYQGEALPGAVGHERGVGRPGGVGWAGGVGKGG